MLQGIFDRAILPTIHFTADGPVVTPLMAGRTGHSVATMDAPVSYVADAYGDADIHQVRDALWTFIGMATGATIRLGEVTFASDDERRALAQGAAEHLVATIS